MKKKPNILVLCGRNKKRSRTAEHLFKNDPRLNIRSAGLSPKSDRKVTENDLNWAHLILVMEPDQKDKVYEIYKHLEIPPVEVLGIEDDYEFMDEELVQMLKDRINYMLAQVYST